MRTRGWIAMCALTALALPATVFASDQSQHEGNKPATSQKKPAKKTPKRALTDEEKANVKELIAKKEARVKELKDKAVEVTMGMGDLAKSGTLPTNDDALELMKKMVQEMGDIKDQLKKIEDDLEELKGWKEGMDESLPVMAFDINDLKRFRDGSYVQFQYKDSNENKDNAAGFSGKHAFELRRVRLSKTLTIDPKTSIKASFDVATGANQTTAQLKDAMLIYDVEPSVEKVGTQIVFGQQNIPLGYEIDRSSAEREFPERAVYNTTMFNGERGRGVYVRHGLGEHLFVHAGIWDAMSVTDPEQAAFNAGVQGRLAGTYGIRYYTKTWDFGISGLSGKRPAVGLGSTDNTKISPEIDRNFIYLDGTYIGFLDPKISLRGELMFGKDRVPNATGSSKNVQTNMRGYQVQAGYTINARNQIFARYEQFDPNTDRTTSGNAITGYGLSYLYYINPNARLTVAWERFSNPARKPNMFSVVTLRIQFRF